MKAELMQDDSMIGGLPGMKLQACNRRALLLFTSNDQFWAQGGGGTREPQGGAPGGVRSLAGEDAWVCCLRDDQLLHTRAGREALGRPQPWGVDMCLGPSHRAAVRPYHAAINGTGTGEGAPSWG